jgi:hypothetical protein
MAPCIADAVGAETSDLTIPGPTHAIHNLDKNSYVAASAESLKDIELS